MPKKIPIEEKQSIGEYYLETKSIPKTGKKFGYSNGSVWSILQSINIDTTLTREDKRWLNQKYEIDESFFQEINTRDKAYIFGLLVADGCIKKSLRQFSISLTDFEYLYLIKDRMKYSGPIRLNETTGISKKESRNLTVSNYKIVNDLISNGMGVNKTYDLTMPTIDKRLFGDFLRGFFDGDGSVSITTQNGFHKAMVSFISTKDFCTSLKDILFSEYGIKGSLFKANGIAAQNIYRFTIGTHKEVSSIFNLMYSDYDGQLFFSRKYNRFIDFFLKRRLDIQRIIDSHLGRLAELPHNTGFAAEINKNFY